MTIPEYRKIREESMKLVHIIIEKIPPQNINHSGKMLGFLEKGVMYFDDEDRDSSVLLDYSIYEKNQKGLRYIDEFYDSEIKLKPNQEDMLEEMIKAHSSLYEVKAIDIENAVIYFVDILNESKKECKFNDLGLSQTAKIGMIFFTRLISFGDDNISTGVSFGFTAATKSQLLKDISLAKFKRNGKLSSSELYILMFKKYKEAGVEIITKQI